MSSFSIQCTTCRSRLKVRDRSAIGQIVGCPKCGSMVLIEAPAQERAASESAASAAGALAPKAAADMPDTVGDSKLDTSFEEAASWFDDEPQEAPVAEHESPTETAEEEPATAQRAVAPLLPVNHAPEHVTPPQSPPPPAEQYESDAATEPLMPGNWVSQATQNYKRIALVGGASALGILGVIGLAIWVTSGSEKPPQVVEQVEPEQPPAQAESPATAEPAKETASSEEPEQLASIPEPEAVPPVESAENQPVATVPETPNEPDEAPAEPETSTAEPLADDDTPTQLTPAPSTPDEQPSESEPPLFTDDLPQTQPANAEQDLAALDALLPLLDGPPQQAPPAELAEPSEPPRMSETQEPAPQEVASLPGEPAPPASDEPVAAKPEPHKIDLQARLNDPIEAIEIPETPLVEFIRLMSDFSTIPITIDPTALDQLQLTPQTPVTVIAGKTTTGKVLEKAVGRLNLLVEEGEGQIIVTHNRSTSGPLRQAKYSVNDLVGQDPQQLEQLRQLVISQIAPGTWRETGGVGVMEPIAGALMVRHNEPVHHQVVLLIEKLRLARGKSLRSRYSPLLFDSAQRAAAFEPKLTQKLSLNYFEPTRFTTILQRLEELTQVTMLVDWEALLEAGWTPDTQATLSLADAPLSEALDELLTPRGLSMRVITPQTIQITTPEALAAERQIELYPVADLLKRKDWQAADLQAALLPRLPVTAEGVRPILGFDRPSGSLVVSASVTTQGKIETLLGDL